MKLFGFALMALSLTLTSCGKDGDDGLDGAVGAQGIPGTDGQDGQDGQNGADGEDGNANVRTFTFDTSSWTGSFRTQDIPEITQSVLDNDVILSYMLSQNGFYYAMPGTVDGGLYNTRPYYRVGRFYVNFNNLDGTSHEIVAGDIANLKVIIIESSQTISGKSSAQDIKKELKSAGIDINDYNAVASYFGLQ